MNLINTSQADRALGVSVRRVQALIKSGRLSAKKLGRDWVIKKSDLKNGKLRKLGGEG